MTKGKYIKLAIKKIKIKNQDRGKEGGIDYNFTQNALSLMLLSMLEDNFRRTHVFKSNSP